MEKSKEQIANELAFQILEYDRREKEAKAEKDRLKAELTDICDEVFATHFTEGVWMLKEAGAMVKTALNPHKCIDSRSGEPLKPEERANIALGISDSYCTVDLNVKEIQKALEWDKNLKKCLEAAHVKVVQDVRYDVKKMK